MDVDGNAQLTFQELEAGLGNLLKDRESVNVSGVLCDALRLFDALDTDHTGSISWSEFAAGALDPPPDALDHTLSEFFQTFDTDKSSSIDSNELYAMLHLLHFGVQPDALDSKLPLRELHKEVCALGKTVNQMMADMDCNKDGVIGFEELKTYIKRMPHKLHGANSDEA